MVHPAIFDKTNHSGFAQFDPKDSFSPQQSFTGATFLRVLRVVDRVDSYQLGGQTTQNWSQ